MDLLDYTSYNQVRACFGTNDVEITDETLGLPLYSSNLSIELDDVSLTLQEKFEEVSLIDAASRTRDQRRFYETVTLFATYTVANHCCISLPMFGPKSVSDSKTEVSRFNDSPYKETIKAIKKQWEILRTRTLAALSVIESTSAVAVERTVMLISVATSDPVTGT